MSPNPPTRGEDNDDSNHKIESMKECFQTRIFVPSLAELLTDVREAKTPRQGACEGIDNEFLQVHARDAGGKTDERANCREQPADEHNDLAESIEPTISEIQIVF